MRTVLQVVQEASAELIREPLTSLINNQDADARLLLQCLSREGRALAKVGENGWTILQRLHSFVTVNGQAEYDLPADYARHIVMTAWDRTALSMMFGPITPATWQTIKSGILNGSPTINRRWRIMRGVSTIAPKFVVDPTPTVDGETLVFEYISNGWCCKADLSAVYEDPLLDTDLVILDRDLMVMGIKWRWRREHGHNIVADLAEYNERVDVAVAHDTNHSPISMVGPTHRSDDEPPMLGWGNIPDQGYGP